MKNKAIVFTVFNRVEYFIKSMSSWSNVDLIQDYDFYFRIEPSDKRMEMISIINDFSTKNKVLCNIVLNEDVLGCGKNTWLAFDELFNLYDFVILSEDDIEVSEDILKYFNYLSEKYNSDEKVAIISANYQLDNFQADLVKRLDVFRGQVWGTWKKYWVDVIRDNWDFAYDSSENGGPSGWDWNLTLRVLPKNNLNTIAPYSSRSQHIGVNGLHSNQSVYEGTRMSSFNVNNIWEEITEL
jgi:hypothetical protein